MNRIQKVGVALVAALAIAFAGASTASAKTEHCPDGGTGHIENGAIDNNLVLPAGTIACVKGGTDAVEFVANGNYTLFQYLGTGHDVSYYVIYESEATPSPTPSIEVTPSPSPSATPSPTPSPSPTASPSESPVPSESPAPSDEPTSTPSVAPTPSTGATMPPTDTVSDRSDEDVDPANIWLILIGIGVLLVADNHYRRAAKREL